MTGKAITARKIDLISCQYCSLLSRIPKMAVSQAAFCPRCGARLHSRKPDSIMYTWALVLASVIFYIPANFLPITITTTLGSTHADTIMSGIIYFIQSGSFEIALVIFVASILIPLVKLLVLISLLLSVHFKSTWRPKDRTKLYRLTESVGRWSMVDIYVISIMVALVKLGPYANVEAGPAAVYFAAVVVITMFAAETFDPRLIWDVAEDAHE